MSETKQRIIHAAADLFHELGVSTVRLQQIADRAEVSVGNLAYHFKNKEAIIQAVYEQLSLEVKNILQVFRQSATLIDLDDQLSRWFAFNQAYSFYFSATLPESVPEAAQLRTQMLSRLVSQMIKRLEYHAQRGVVEPSVNDPQYKTVAEVMSMTITFWSSYQSLRFGASADEKKFKIMVWAQVFPYLTARGEAEYQQLIYPLLSTTP